MRRWLPEAVLAAVLFVLILVLNQWQAPGERLTADEVERYLARIEQRAPIPAALMSGWLPGLRVWGLADDGEPFFMLNLMRYHDQLQPWPGTRVQAATPQDANRHYESVTVARALPMGLSMAFAGEPQSTGSVAAPSASLFAQLPGVDALSRVLVVRYPSRRAFFELISNPDYLANELPYKAAALQFTLVPMSGQTVTPDLRLIAALAALIVFLGFAWLRALRSA